MTTERSWTATKECALNLRASLLLLFLVFTLGSCQRPDEVVIPEGTLPESTMIAMLTDMHLVEGAKVGNKIMGDTLPAPVYFEKVYSKHGITEDQFEENFRFYSANPKLMAKIYDQVIVNLNKIDITPPKEKLNDDITREQTTIAAPLKSLTDKVDLKKTDSTKASQPE